MFAFRILQAGKSILLDKLYTEKVKEKQMQYCTPVKFTITHKVILGAL